MRGFNKKYLVLLITMLFFSITLIGYGQETASNSFEKEQSKEMAGLEIIVSNIVIHNTGTNHTDFSNELHITYWTSHTWAVGVGYSLIYEEESRVGHELAALVSHKPWPILTLNAGPSFSFANSEKDFEVSAYMEGELNIKIGKKGLHTGPVIGALVGSDFRYFGGIHLGYEF